jgi:hypothetical protein
MVRTTSGTYCVEHDNVGRCGDSVYALRVRGLLPVEPGDRVTLFTHDRKIRRLHVSLIRAGSTIHWDTRRAHPRGNLTDRLARAYARMRAPASLPLARAIRFVDANSDRRKQIMRRQASSLLRLA